MRARWRRRKRRGGRQFKAAQCCPPYHWYHISVHSFMTSLYPLLLHCNNVVTCVGGGGGIARGARSSHLARIRRLQASKPEQAAAPESTGHKELFQCDVVFTLSDTCCRKSIWHCGECTDCPPPAVAPPRPKNVHSARIGPSCKILFITVSASSMFLMLSCLHFYSPCTRCRRCPILILTS